MRKFSGPLSSEPDETCLPKSHRRLRRLGKRCVGVLNSGRTRMTMERQITPLQTFLEKMGLYAGGNGERTLSLPL